MDKRLKDCIRHMDELDYESLSEEETMDKRRELLTQIGFLQHALFLRMFWTGLLIVCLVITTAAVFVFNLIAGIVTGVISAIACGYAGNEYVKRSRGLRQVYKYYDNLMRI